MITTETHEAPARTATAPAPVPATAPPPIPAPAPAPGGMLDQLMASAREQTARRRRAYPAEEFSPLSPQAVGAPRPRDFAAALREPGLGVIAEMKPRSPSKGALTTWYRPAELARSYQLGGADAVSVLTHEDGFGGAPGHLSLAHAETRVPVLRKDFIDDEYQLLEARALGADAVLLIVAALSAPRLSQLLELTRALGMEALVEVHDERETDTALSVGAAVIGVNQRDLRDFSLDRALPGRLRARVGSRRVMVGESGVRGAADARQLREAGMDAVLVGELLMRSEDPGATITELKGR